MSLAADPHPLRRSAEHTRALLLDAAFEDLQHYGYRAMRLDRLLDRLDLTKGALYHHFRGKSDLVSAVIEERLRPWIEATWQPVLGADDLVDAAIRLTRQLTAERAPTLRAGGCPLGTLLHELGSAEAALRQQLQGLIEAWQAGIAGALREGQRRGRLRAEIPADDAAAFIVAAIEGGGNLACAPRGEPLLEAAMRGLTDYLHHLRLPRSSR